MGKGFMITIPALDKDPPNPFRPISWDLLRCYDKRDFSIDRTTVLPAFPKARHCPVVFRGTSRTERMVD
jgi:hypothetical protein